MVHVHEIVTRRKTCVATVVLYDVEETNSEAIDPTLWLLQVYIENIEELQD